MRRSLSIKDEISFVLVDSATKTFEGVLGVNVIHEPLSKIDSQLCGDYSGAIYLIDYRKKIHIATLCVTFTEPALKYILYPIYGEEINLQTGDTSAMLRDGIGEISNIIFTSIKSQLNDRGHSLLLSLPIILEGKNHIINKDRERKSFRIPFKTNKYEFFIDAFIEINKDDTNPKKWDELEDWIPLIGLTKD